jgi:DNA-binding response OmpR family regulator
MTVLGTPVRSGIVDSDRAFTRVLVERLAALGWPHRTMASLVPIEALRAMRLDVLVIDLLQLEPHGWTYLEKVCGELPQMGVLVCTGESTVAQRVRALRLGIDDWGTKPCHPEELIARVEAVVRRRRRALATEAAAPILVGELEIMLGGFQAFAGGELLEVRPTEFELLQLLATAEGRVLKREEIYERVWGYAMVRGDRSVDVYVRKLRQKLERASPEWRHIHTHFGVGYRFEAEPVALAPHRLPAGRA